MARHEGKIRAAGEVRLQLDELLKLIDQPEKNPLDEGRCARLARFLSGEEDGESLGGAFAERRLRDEKEI